MIYSSTVLMIFSALAVGAVPLPLRGQEPNLSRPYRTPLYPFMPGFFALMSIVIVASAFYERPVEGSVGLATVLAGTPLYLLWRWLDCREAGCERKQPRPSVHAGCRLNCL